MGCGLSLR
jgi:hypothetical protein